MATVHLTSGLPCSGKTTYAAALAAETRGVHYQLDYWLITAFRRYSIDVLRERIRKRNDSLPPYNFRIEPAMLDLFVGLYETPSGDEGAQLVVVDADGAERGGTERRPT